MRALSASVNWQRRHGSQHESNRTARSAVSALQVVVKAAPSTWSPHRGRKSSVFLVCAPSGVVVKQDDPVRVEGRQRKQYADTLTEARAIKLKRDGEARTRRCGPTLHGFSLSWLDSYADSVRANTRREYRRLLVDFALSYFDREVRVRDLDRVAVQHFVDWLTTRPGRAGRLCSRARYPKHAKAAANIVRLSAALGW